MTRNLKGGVGPFKIFHIGKMSYTVECDGKVLDTVEGMNNAYLAAERHNALLQIDEQGRTQ